MATLVCVTRLLVPFSTTQARTLRGRKADAAAQRHQNTGTYSPYCTMFSNAPYTEGAPVRGPLG